MACSGSGRRCQHYRRPGRLRQRSGFYAQKAGLRAEADLRNGKITYKIRELSLQKLPYILVVGAKEKAEGKVAVRVRGGKDLGAMSVEDFIKLVQEDVATRRNVNEIE